MRWGEVRVLIRVEVGDGVCCGDSDDWDNYWGHSGRKTWGRAKKKKKTQMLGCGDEQIKWMDYWSDSKRDSDFTVGREGACRAVTIRSTETYEENERKCDTVYTGNKLYYCLQLKNDGTSQESYVFGPDYVTFLMTVYHCVYFDADLNGIFV